MIEWLLANGLKILGGLISTILAGFVVKILLQVSKKLKIDITDQTEEKVRRLVKQAVLEVNQVYVEGLKKKGRFNEEAQKQARTTVYKRITELLLQEGLELLKVKDIESKVEATINETKKDIKGNKGYVYKKEE